MKSIDHFNWYELINSLDSKGYALLPKVLTSSECDELMALYAEDDLYRKKVVMERYRFGLGEYKYFHYPLPEVVHQLRTDIYSKLRDTANASMARLKKPFRYPETHQDFLEQCRGAGQHLPAVLMLKYGHGGHNTLHQDLYGDVFSPVQMVIFLSDPEVDYEGGEFVLTQQNPRAQSTAMVLRPGKGDILCFTTHSRPAQGSRGYYAVNVKHGVSEVRNGQRYTLGIIFHDAKS